MANKVGIYTRLSDEDRNKSSPLEDSESIQNQKSMLIEYCLKKGWEIVSIYSDDDYSGADRNRPGWNQLIADCEARKVDIVLCKSQSRFSRDLEMIEKYLHGKFVEWNIRFIGLVDNADTEIAGNKKSRQINGLVNEWYLEDLSENIRSVLEHKRRRGEFTGSFAPFGYLIDPKDKHHLIPDPQAAPVVADIFHQYLQGWGYIKIAKWLNERGIPSPTEHKRLLGIPFSPGKQPTRLLYWTAPTIFHILRNETYTGTLVQGKSHPLSYKNEKVIKLPQDQWIRSYDAHDAIIDQVTWNAVQNKLQVQTRSSRLEGEKHPLCGKIFCSECGSPMVKLSTQSGKKRYFYLQCKNARLSSKLCKNSSFFRLDWLEGILLQEINKLLSQYYQPHKIAFPKSSSTSLKHKFWESEYQRLNTKYLTRQDMILKLYEDRVAGLVHEEQFYQYLKRIQQELAQIEKQKKVVWEEIQKNCLSDDSNTPQQFILDHQHLEELSHTITDEWVEKIEIGIKKAGERRRVRICWKF